MPRAVFAMWSIGISRWTPVAGLRKCLVAAVFLESECTTCVTADPFFLCRIPEARQVEVRLSTCLHVQKGHCGVCQQRSQGMRQSAGKPRGDEQDTLRIGRWRTEFWRVVWHGGCRQPRLALCVSIRRRNPPCPPRHCRLGDQSQARPFAYADRCAESASQSTSFPADPQIAGCLGLLGGRDGSPAANVAVSASGSRCLSNVS